MRIKENIELARFTTLGVGGRAAFYCEPENETEIAEAVAFAEGRQMPLFVLGGGSNVVIADAGFDGSVVHIDVKGITSTSSGQAVLVTAGAGEVWDGLVRRCVEQSLAGIECLSGIPGNVGGTPVQNVGAYGQEVSETITRVRCFDRRTNSFVNLSNADCGFSYRRSIFNTIERDRYIVVSVEYRLVPGGVPKVEYADLKAEFGGREPSLQDVRDAVLKIRRSKSMVIDPADPNSRSVGSFFKNPIVPPETAERLEEIFGAKAPVFPAEGGVKVSAAWLIERAGFHKGYRQGNAGISANHSLAIINLGNATAVDIIRLKDAIQHAVEDKTGIRLMPEPVFVGG